MAEGDVGFVQLVSDELKRLREAIERQDGRIQGLQDSIHSLQTGKVASLELQLATLRAGAMESNEKAIEKLAAGQMWLSRLLMGALLTGIVAGVITLVFKALG